MTPEQILKAFNNRWRIKSENNPKALIKGVRDLCLDFFRAGILLGEGFQVAEIFNGEGEPTGQTMAYMRDPILDTADNGFSDFWNLYDKKVGRPKCEKLWEKLTINEKEACLGYIPLYKQAQPDKQFRKNPETFLRNKSWNDEIIYRNNEQQQQQQRLAEAARIIAKYN